LFRLIDRFSLILLATVVVATLLPCEGDVARVFDVVTIAAIAALFFLHGAKLSREAIVQGITNWRLHLLVLAITFILFPLLGLGAREVALGLLTPSLAAGILFLTLLPSTVQSSIAFTSIAGGNVPAAVCSASASNLIGIGLTPILVAAFMGGEAHVSGDQIWAIIFQLLVPFVAGHLSRPLTRAFVERNRAMLSVVDRGSILLVVYTAFSAAVVEGLWTRLPIWQLLLVGLFSVVLLALVMVITVFLAARLGFDRADRIAILFCGSKKSLASGVPIAGVLFPAAQVGPIILPLMIFHQLQLLVCASIAQHYARRAASEAEAEEAVVAG
jgi:sodium/bile acid cotransporter 7